MKDNSKKTWMTSLKDVAGKTYNKMADSFNNPGLSYGPQSNEIGREEFSNERLSDRWQELTKRYRTNSLYRKLVDVAADDMTREQLIFTGIEDPRKIEELQTEWGDKGISSDMGSAMSMARLLGGSIAYIYIDGQDSSTKLDLNTVSRDSFVGLNVFHRWELSSSIEVDFFSGEPIYYDITSSDYVYTENSPKKDIMPRLHASRCIKLSGDYLPKYEWIENLRWHASIFEAAQDRVLYLNTGVAAIAGILTKSSLRTYKVNDLQGALATGDDGKGESSLDKGLAAMKRFQSTEGITVIDALDDIEINDYNVSGIDTLQNQLRLDVMGAFRYPATKIFMDTPSGLNATGDNDTRMYYDEIKSAQEKKLRKGYTILIQVLYRSRFGKNPPKDFSFKFTPLWQMSDKEKSEISVNNVTAVTMAYNAGIISQETALKELSQQSNSTGLFTNISDEDIENSETSDPPSPDDIDGEGPVELKSEVKGIEKEESDSEETKEELKDEPEEIEEEEKPEDG